MKPEVRASSLHAALLVLVALSVNWPIRTTVADDASAPNPAVSFSFELPRAAFTSAGIYDGQDHLVRVLWTQRQLDAGRHTGQWDGKDELGAAVPPGAYQFRVVANGSRYRNVGAIGNSGRGPTPEAHTPTGLLSVAVDDRGAVYTANGWDEAGADFKKWDALGNSVYDAHYQIRNGNPNGAPYAIAVDDEAIYCAMGGWAREPWNHKQQLQRFARRDGSHQRFTKVDDKAGHVQVYEWPEKLIPPGAPPQDAELMREPLRALAISGDTLLAADALGGKVRRYHKVTGQSQGDFRVPLPGALAVAPDGRIWVGHQHKFVSVFSPQGRKIALALRDLREVAGLAFGPGGQLYVADSEAGQVKIYDLAGDKAVLRRTLGEKAKAGDRAADRFFRLRGVAVDPQGHVVTIQTEPAGGARLARWSPQGKLLWEHFGCEFVSLGNYGRHDPDAFYSMTFHRYRLEDRAVGRWQYLGCTVARRPVYKGDVHGVPRLLRFGGADFWFMPTGDGLQVYRVEGGTMRLVSILGAGWPDADGKRGKPGQWS